MSISFDTVIIGGGVAGLQAALYATTEGLSALVIEKSEVGGKILHTPRIENIAGAGDVSGLEFIGTMTEQCMDFGVEFEYAEVVSLSRHPYRGWNVNLKQNLIHTETVILATGTRWRNPSYPVESHKNFTLGVYPYAHKNAKKVVIVGGGNSMGQIADMYLNQGKEVYIITRSPSLSCSAYLRERFNTPLFHHIIGDVLSIEQDDEGETIVEWESKTHSGNIHNVDYVHHCAGLMPNTNLMPHAKRDDRGFYIVTDEGNLISDVDYSRVFAVGSCVSGIVNAATPVMGSSCNVINVIRDMLKG